MVLAGGKLDPKDTPSGRTSHFDGTTWVSYPTDFGDKHEPPESKVLAYDERSGHLFLLTWHLYRSRCLVWTYLGEGAWAPSEVEPLARLASYVGAVGVGAGYDSARRTVVAFGLLDDGTGGIGAIELPLGKFLDVLPKPRVGEARRSSKSPGGPRSANVAARAEARRTVRLYGAYRVEHQTPRYLRFVEDGSDKVWSAAVEGTNLVLRWGRRGGKAEEKVLPCDTSEAAQQAFEEVVAEKMREAGSSPYPTPPDVPKPLGEPARTIAGRYAFVMSLGGGEVEDGDLFGGAPRGIDASRWPECPDCRVPMVHVATFAAEEVRLPLTQHIAMSVFACMGTMGKGMCESWDPRGSATAVLLVSKPSSAPAWSGAPQGPARRPIAYTPRFETDPAAEGAEPLARVSKLGGYPLWLQRPDVPLCAACGARMRFVGMIEAAIDPDFPFADRSAGYLFLCSDEHEGRFFWQTA
jgi:predicted DNA-binding WGR domain protein